jgi:hypothetical protein
LDIEIGKRRYLTEEEIFDLKALVADSDKTELASK